MFLMSAQPYGVESHFDFLLLLWHEHFTGTKKESIKCRELFGFARRRHLSSWWLSLRIQRLLSQNTESPEVANLLQCKAWGRSKHGSGENCVRKVSHWLRTMPFDLPFGDTWPQRIRHECRTGGTRRAMENHEIMRDTKYVARKAQKRGTASAQMRCAVQNVQL